MLGNARSKDLNSDEDPTFTCQCQLLFHVVPEVPLHMQLPGEFRQILKDLKYTNGETLICQSTTTVSVIQHPTMAINRSLIHRCLRNKHNYQDTQ